MENLRKVIYSLEGEHCISTFAAPNEKEQEKLKEKQKERRGLFHRFGDKIA